MVTCSTEVSSICVQLVLQQRTQTIKKRRFSEEQIVGILEENQAGLGAKDLCRKHRISDAIFYKWRSKYGDMEVSSARRLKTWESENGKLKKMLAEQTANVTTQFVLTEDLLPQSPIMRAFFTKYTWILVAFC